MFDQFLSNESRFGRLMTRLGILIAANLLFLISCIPVVTAGAGLCALYHTMLKTLRGDGEINPFVQFFLGFRRNFKQATEAFLLLLLANSFAFAMKSPLTALCVDATSAVPVMLTLAGGRYQPLYAFIWCMIGASGLAMLHASMLLQLFLPYLPRVDICGDIIPEGMEDEWITEAQAVPDSRAALEDMIRLGM